MNHLGLFLRPVSAVLCCLMLAACGDGSSSGESPPPAELPPLPPPDNQGRPGPEVGSSRAGASYDVHIVSADGHNIAFTVHEPASMVGGLTYPLLLQGPGFGGLRTNAGQRDALGAPGAPLVDNATTRQYTDAGYGVLSFDQRGFGQSGGDVAFMDPDKEGVDLIRIVDWAEANLDWLMVRDSNLVLGAYGVSYGGAYQLLLNAIDPRQRLDALVPHITWNDLAHSLAPGDVAKAPLLQGLAFTGGTRLAAEASAVLSNGANNSRFSEDEQAYLRYHSNRYFCEGVTQPGRRPARQPPRVDALFFQGTADILFNLNEGRDNLACLRESGGDVRLYSYVTGHLLPGGAGMPPGGDPNSADLYRCGPYLADAMAKLWFDAKLRQDPLAVSALAQAPEVCINLGIGGDAVGLSAVPVGDDNDINIPPTAVSQLNASPVLLPLLTTSAAGTVVAGIPTATLTLANPAPNAGISDDDAIVFVAIGRIRAGGGPLQILGDQVRPIRGLGTQAVELNGIGVRLAAGDQLVLVVVGQAAAQFPIARPRNPLLPVVTVSGSVRLPVLGDVPALRSAAD